jgi:hypothetical protein
LDVFVVALENVAGDPIDKGQPELSVDWYRFTGYRCKIRNVVTVAIDEQVRTETPGFRKASVEGGQDLGVAVAVWFTPVEEEGSNLVDV